ncbi:hypothetical protein MJI95_30865, partial [Salmonella enterica subsp. enterica serovar Kentucky]|nr:hypothetical protein [Salmonella enterica subsp. enterica serovar Kentucky]
RQLTLWKREDLQSPQLDDVAEEVPVALVYNGISHVVMMASPKMPLMEKITSMHQEIVKQRLLNKEEKNED